MGAYLVQMWTTLVEFILTFFTLSPELWPFFPVAELFWLACSSYWLRRLIICFQDQWSPPRICWLSLNILSFSWWKILSCGHKSIDRRVHAAVHVIRSLVVILSNNFGFAGWSSLCHYIWGMSQNLHTTSWLNCLSWLLLLLLFEHPSTVDTGAVDWRVFKYRSLSNSYCGPLFVSPVISW